MSTRQTTSRLEMIQARFQQKQLQEKEQMLLQLYDQQQQRAYQVMQRGSAGSNASNGSSNNQSVTSRSFVATYASSGPANQGGKVRQMFDERRQTTKGIDRSHPLEPLDNKLPKDVIGHSESKYKMPVKSRQFASVRTETRADVNSNVNDGKPVISYREEITRNSFDAPARGDVANDHSNVESYAEEVIDRIHRYNDQRQSQVEEVFDSDTIERNRMMAKIHLMDYDESMKHRVKNDLQSEQFPEDFMIDVPDILPRKNVTRKMSQAEARLERFRMQNTKKNSVPKTVTRSVTKKTKEEISLSKPDTKRRRDVIICIYQCQVASAVCSNASRSTISGVMCAYKTKNERNILLDGLPKNVVLVIRIQEVPGSVQMFREKRPISVEVRTKKAPSLIVKPKIIFSKSQTCVKRQCPKYSHSTERKVSSLQVISRKPTATNGTLKERSNITNRDGKMAATGAFESSKARPEFFCKETERSATTFAIKPKLEEESFRNTTTRTKTNAASPFHEKSVKDNMTASNASTRKSGKGLQAKQNIVYRPYYGFFRETASSILKRKKKKEDKQKQSESLFAVPSDAKIAATDVYSLKSVDYDRGAMKNKETKKEKLGDHVLTSRVEGNKDVAILPGKYANITGSGLTTARSASRDRPFTRLSQNSKLCQKTFEPLRASRRNDTSEFKKSRISSLKRSPSVKQLRSIEDIRKSIYRAFAICPKLRFTDTPRRVEPSTPVKSKLSNESVATFSEKRPRIVERHFHSLNAIASANYETLKRIRNTELGRLGSNMCKKTLHPCRIVRDSRADSPAKKIVDIKTRTTVKKSESTSPSGNTYNNTSRTAAIARNGEPETSGRETSTKTTVFSGGERLSSSVKSPDHVDFQGDGDGVSSNYNGKEMPNEKSQPVKRAKDRQTSSAASTVSSNTKDKMAMKVRVGTRASKSPGASPKNAGDKSGSNTGTVIDGLIPCKICGRRFADDRIGRHEQICTKTTQKKRKQFDAMLFRVKGTDLEPFVKKGTSKKQVEVKAKKPETKSNWRRKHEDFINAIRSAKQVQAHLAAGGKLSDLPPPPVSDTSDYIQCPHCGRKFNQAAAERHIPKCQNMLHNKTSNARTSLRSKR